MRQLDKKSAYANPNFNAWSIVELKNQLLQLDSWIDSEKRDYEVSREIIIKEFQEAYTSYRTSNNIQIDIFSDTEEQFIAFLKNANTLEQSDLALTKKIDEIITLEVSFTSNGKNALSKKLVEKRKQLRERNYLKRKFDEDILPEVKNLVADYYHKYLKNTKGVAETEYTSIFNNLVNNINNSCHDEEMLSKEIDASLVGIDLLKANRRFHLVFFAYTDTILRNSLENLKAVLKQKGYLDKQKIKGGGLENYLNLRGRIVEALAQKGKPFAISMEEIKQKNKDAFALIMRSLMLNKTHLFVAEYSQKFINIIGKTREEESSDVDALKNELAEFWSEFSIQAQEKYHKSPEIEKIWWKRLNNDIKKARTSLVNLNYLSKSYVEDSRFALLNLCQHLIKKSYTRKIGSVSKEREKQTSELYILLQNSKSSSEARTLIEKNIFKIKLDHETKSLAYNMFRKPSRTVTALERLLKLAEKQGLIVPKEPNGAKAISDIISERLEQDYFSQDFFKNSLSRQRAKYALLEKIRQLEEKVVNGEE